MAGILDHDSLLTTADQMDDVVISGNERITGLPTPAELSSSLLDVPPSFLPSSSPSSSSPLSTLHQLTAAHSYATHRTGTSDTARSHSHSHSSTSTGLGSLRPLSALMAESATHGKITFIGAFFVLLHYYICTCTQYYNYREVM